MESAFRPEDSSVGRSRGYSRPRLVAGPRRRGAGAAPDRGPAPRYRDARGRRRDRMGGLESGRHHDREGMPAYLIEDMDQVAEVEGELKARRSAPGPRLDHRRPIGKAQEGQDRA